MFFPGRKGMRDDPRIEASSIDERFEAAMRGEAVDAERLRDDAWTHWRSLLEKVTLDLAAGRPIDGRFVRALLASARASAFLEHGCADWARASKAAAAAATAVRILVSFPGLISDGEWSALGEALRRFPEVAAYSLHRAGLPADVPRMLEALSSLQAGQQMTQRSLEALAESHPDAVARMAQAGPELLAAARAELAAAVAGATNAHEGNEAPWGVGDIAGQYLAASLDSYAPRAAAVSGRHVLYVVAGMHGGAVIRVDPDGTGYRSIELPDFSLMAGFDLLAAIVKAPRGVKARARAIRDVLDRVGDMLWRPVMEQWPDLGDGRLAVIPVGETAHIPFYTGMVDGLPACARWDLTVVSSARALLVAASRAISPPAGAAVIADRARGRPGLPEITFAVDEAERVSAGYGVVPRILDGPVAQAGELLDLIAELPVVHLACHGDVNHDDPFDSLLYAGQGLRLEQIWTHRLRAAPVVVLSACHVGGISGDQPAEQLGFTSAFLLCGARAVLGALWEVPDRADTAAMMANLHGLMRSGLPASLALGEAVATAIRHGVSPAVWGPFVHFGA